VSAFRFPSRSPGPHRGLNRWTRAVLLTVVGACLLSLFSAEPVWAANSIPQVISNLRNWIVGILAGLATLFLTVGGARYLMAGGDPSEVESAKRAMRAAATGYGLAVLAPVIVAILQQIVGTS
jgi:hypothetical protein